MAPDEKQIPRTRPRGGYAVAKMASASLSLLRRSFGAEPLYR